MFVRNVGLFVYALVEGRRTVAAWLLLAAGVTEARGLAD